MSLDFTHAPDRTQTNSLKWTQYPEGVLPLWVADTDFPAPEPILEALRTRLQHGVLGYEFAMPPLRAAVAARMQELYGWVVAPEAVVATPGIVSAFNTAAWALCEPGQGVLVQPPIYPPFLDLARNVGLVTQFAPLERRELAGVLSYHLDLQAFRGALHDRARTGMFLLCNPHNPTGLSNSRADLEAMASLCLEQGVPIVSDEIHSELVLGGTTHLPIAALSREVERHTITLVAPSKTYNVPGLFCGFAIIPDAELRRRFLAAQERLTHHVSSLSLVAAQAAFSGACEPWLQALRAQLTANRDWLSATLRRRFPELPATLPQATYLAWVDCRRLQVGAETPYEFFLRKARVAFGEGRDFGPGGEGHVRINFGTTPERLAEAMERVEAALRG